MPETGACPGTIPDALPRLGQLFAKCACALRKIAAKSAAGAGIGCCLSVDVTCCCNAAVITPTADATSASFFSDPVLPLAPGAAAALRRFREY